MPVNADWDRGIRRGLTAARQAPVELNVEYLDLGRNEDEEYLRKWLDLLRLKYADRRIDLVLPVYSPALEFALEHRDALFPDVPIVFCSASRDVGRRARNQPRVTGVGFRLDFDRTLQAARDLYPDTERVLVVCGGSERDRSFREAARRVLDAHRKNLDIEYVAGLPLPQLLERMAGLGPRTIVLMLVYDKDGAGTDYITREVVEQLARVCPAPIFGLYDTLLGHGIVGGSLLMVEAQGELAGRMATRVLNGEDPSRIPVAGWEMNQFLFDARQLRRWNVGAKLLPEGATVRYREATFWEQYGVYCLLGLLILGVQSVVIAALIVNRLRRQHAERALAERLQFESLLSDVSSRFVHVPADELGGEIQRALGRIAEFLDLDGGTLFRVSANGTELLASHSWLGDDFRHPAASIRLTEIPRCWECITRGEVFCFTTLADLPDDAPGEQELFRRVGLRSAIMLPLRASGATIGMVAFGSRHRSQRWNDAMVRGLALIGGVFANALAHAHADEALRTSRTEACHLAGRLLTAQEDERRRLARELHDDLSQRLAATAIEAGKLEQRFAEPGEPRHALSTLKNALVTIADDVHQISRQIHPAILDDLGLADALRSECNGSGERHGYRVVYRCGDLPRELPKDVALCLYRIVQEALRNAANHAMADCVDVVLRADAEFVYLEVRDSGRGFHPDQVAGRPGLGLASMEERARLVGGELTVSSEPGHGTSIAVRIPLPEEDA